MVFAFHLGTTLDQYSSFKFKPWIQIGMVGVDLFFVISGFVMAFSVRAMAGPADAGTFLARRIWRIAPLLYILTLAQIGFVALRHQFFDSAQIINSFTILPIMHSPERFQHALAPAWTLAFELGFYLIVTAVVASNFRWRLSGFAVGAVAAGMLFSTFMFEFALGVACYAIWSRNMLVGRLPLVLGLAGLALLAASLNGPRYLVAGVPCALILMATLPFNPQSKSLLWLGNISYSLYLTHLIAFEALASIVALFLPIGGVAVVIGIGGILISWLVYEAIESPLMALAKRRPEPDTSTTDVAVAVAISPAKESI